MGEELGVDVVIRNHTGAGGRRAVDAVRRGQPDGYTISIMNMPMQLMAEKLDPVGADFEGLPVDRSGGPPGKPCAGPEDCVIQHS